jgi:hypothetical protein
MENLKNNKLIAEFMGWTLDDKDLNSYRKLNNNVFKYSLLSNFKYHTDWNWLMEVVEKILNICLELDSMEMYYSITDSIPDINQSYNEVIEFINWYNGNK